MLWDQEGPGSPLVNETSEFGRGGLGVLRGVLISDDKAGRTRGKVVPGCNFFWIRCVKWSAQQVVLSPQPIKSACECILPIANPFFQALTKLRLPSFCALLASPQGWNIGG